MSARPGRAIVFAERIPVHMNVESLDADELRRRFSQLFDRSARAVQFAGYDLDDVLVQRYLACHLHQSSKPESNVNDPHIQHSSFSIRHSLRIPAEPLSDRDRLVKTLCDAMHDVVGEPVPADQICIIGLEIVAELEREPGRK